MTTTDTEPLYRKVGRRYVPVSNQLGNWDGFMATCAVRYCLGRASYAPSVAMDWCRDNWHRLSPKDHHNIVRDVVQWLADRKIWDDGKGMTMEDYRGEWTRFALDRIAADGDEFGRSAVRAALYSEEHRTGEEVQPFLKWVNA